MSNFTRLALPKRGSGFLRKLLSVIFLTPVAVSLSAWSFQDGEEKVTIKGNDVPLITVFKTIKKQTGYSFFYAADYVNDQEKVDVDVKNAKVDDVLKKVLGRDYVWVYNDNAVSITKKKEELKTRRNSLASESIPDSSVTQITVSGSVTDAKGVPIPGATIIVKGTKDGANSDENGNFSLPGVKLNATLVISSIGFEKREIPVRGRTILAKLNVDVNNLNETVIVAYGTTTQRANTGAITTVKGQQIESLPNRSFDRSLQGQVPGLLVTSGNGQPGGGLSNFVLRGIGTGTNEEYGSTIRHPLVIIDGMPISTDNFVRYGVGGTEAPIVNPLAQLNPADIESISVLKDAAAIALYGSKAANGVILVTTKRGRVGKVAVSFRHQTDVSSRMKGKLDVLDQEKYLELLYESYRNDNSTLWTDEAIRKDLRDKFPYRISVNGDTSYYSSPNWEKELYSENATTVSNDLTFTGGSEKTIYYFNVGNTTQNGVVKNTGYNRTSLRFNTDSRLNEWLKIGINSTFSINKQKFASASEGASSPIGMAYAISPLNPIYLDNGEYLYTYKYGTPGYYFYPISNPAAVLKYNINRVNSYRGVGNFFAEVNFLKSLKYSINAGVEYMQTIWKEKIDPRLAIGSLTPGIGRITDDYTTRTGYNITNVLRYENTFRSNHNVNILVAQEARSFNERTLVASGEGLSSPSYEELRNTTGNFYNSGNSYLERLLSYFAQANYNYSGKYFVSLNGRRDGGSKFGSRDPFRSYWSVGAGWIMTEEKFLKSSWLNYLKLRGSIGTSGNSTALSELIKYYILGLTNYNGNPAAITSSLPNLTIEPEKPLNVDIGLDARLFNGRVEITADLYRRKISRLLYDTPTPNNSGSGSTILDNIGDMENKGIELVFSVDVLRTNNFKWNFNINWSTNRNRLIRSNRPLISAGNFFVNKEGENFNSFYLVRWAGVNPADGSPQWLDSAGKVTSTFNYNDRVIVGKPQPDGFGGITNTFRYKNIELTAFLYYQYGFQIFDEGLHTLLNDGASSPFLNQSIKASDRWRKPGDQASNPKRVLNNTSGSDQISTRYLFDGDFISLKNITISYSISGRAISKVKVSSINVFLQANNLAIWTKFPGADPQNVGIGGGTSFPYPQQRTYSLGFNVNF